MTPKHPDDEQVHSPMGSRNTWVWNDALIAVSIILISVLTVAGVITEAFFDTFMLIIMLTITVRFTLRLYERPAKVNRPSPSSPSESDV